MLPFLASQAAVPLGSNPPQGSSFRILCPQAPTPIPRLLGADVYVVSFLDLGGSSFSFLVYVADKPWLLELPFGR